MFLAQERKEKKRNGNMSLLFANKCVHVCICIEKPSRFDTEFSQIRPFNVERKGTFGTTPNDSAIF